jgi:flagellar basal-body rod modification protein FlgD
MSAIDALSGGTQQAARPTGMSALTSEDFSKIIFTELSNQDPMSPNDTNALLQQVSTLRSIQADTDLSDRLKSLVRQNQFAAGATLLGKQVSGISDQNQRAQGTVKSVSNTADGAVVTLITGERIPMSSLDSVVTPSGT